MLMASILHKTEGPQFSTRAESNMYRSWGGTVINMSTLPEAKLAAEAEIAYQVILMSTDYDVSLLPSLFGASKIFPLS